MRADQDRLVGPELAQIGTGARHHVEVGSRHEVDLARAFRNVTAVDVLHHVRTDLLGHGRLARAVEVGGTLSVQDDGANRRDQDGRDEYA
jgi:hypothetical protein